MHDLLTTIRACTQCSDLPLGPRPVLAATPRSSIVLIGQAPGTRVHESGVPWDDASGDHLREWLAVDKDRFYDADAFAILPMGFCYPGRKAGGDAPPRKECAPLWHARVLAQVNPNALLVLIGAYAVAHYLGRAKKRTLTETVRAHEEYLPRYFVLPHPSWRSRLWMKKNPWFADTVLPSLRDQIHSRI